MSYAKDDTKEVTTEPESIKISNAENVNIDDIINKNFIERTDILKWVCMIQIKLLL